MPLGLRNKTILYSCLNWGNGHVSRSIGVIRELLKENNQVLFAGDENQIAIMKAYFPEMECLELTPYPFSFTTGGNFATDLYKSRTPLMKHVKVEFEWVQEQLEKNPAIDTIISDHRYGFYSQKVPSIFITHQVKLATKWYQFPAQYVHKMLYYPFSEIWIMDEEQERMAGKLSEAPKGKKYQYIGHFSRFEKGSSAEKTIALGVVNGPKPYSEELFKALEEGTETDQIIVPEEFYYKSLDKRLVNAKDWKSVDSYFEQAHTIHSYCGYSTLMDMKILGCRGVLKPTPGQMEQEYLFKLHFQK